MFQRILALNQYNELLLNLVLRDLKVRYRGSLLGVVWALMEPLLLMVLFTIVFSYFLKFQIPRYPVFLFSGLLAWSFFSTGVQYSATSINTNANLIRKIYFPREILPLAIIIGRLVHFLLSFLAFIPFLAFFGVRIGAQLAYFPLLVLIEFTLVYGISLIASSLNAFFSDVGFLLQFVVNLLFYLTPVFYPVSYVPEKYRTIYLLNPLAAVIESFRQIFYLGTAPSPNLVWLSFFVSALVVWIGYRVFVWAEPRFAELL